MVETGEELALMRVSGRLLASVFEMLDRMDLAGLSTLAVNDRVERFITDTLKARPASKTDRSRRRDVGRVRRAEPARPGVRVRARR
ncbi:hypothetical protein ASG07_07445 [Sphingomonas sp. Leaf343]|nr:hypothetical protein ASG07_07445 [Sphingomonas sp. Leaf343]